MRQTIEAQFCQPFNYGTSAAKTLTLSFYAKANASKTYGVSLWKRDSTAYYWFQDISVTTSWQRFEIVISPTAGSTSLITSSNGAIANDNGEGLEVSFVLASGSNYQATADTWTSNQDFNTTNLDNFLSSTDNTFRVTGVQLEVGDQATDFEHLPFDVQLRRCKRYYQQITGSYAQYGQIMNGHYNGTTQFQGVYTYPVEMRSSPTLSHTTTSSNNSSSAYAIATVGSIDYIDALLLYGPNDHSTLIYTAGNASNDAGMGGNMYVQSTITELALVSEL
jgi:hypothetical protein